MSFGGFSFGKSTSAPNSASQPSVPSFSLTAATPNLGPSSNPTQSTAAQPFSFGSTTASTTQQPGASGSSMFGQAQQQGGQQQQQGGGLFGSAPAAGGSSLFGAKPAQPAAGTSSTGGLFGGGGGGSSLFGAQPQQQQTQQQQTQQPSLFGSTSQQQPSTSLFGSTASKAAGTGMFGTAASSTQSQQQQQTGSLFGQPQQQPQAGASTSLFGQPAQQQQQTQPQQQQQGLSGSTSSGSGGQGGGISKTTKFTDLPENVQKTIEQFDAGFKQMRAAGQGMNVELLGKVIWETSGEIKAATEEHSALAQSIQSINASLNSLRQKFQSEEEDIRKIAEIWETFKSVDGRPGAVRVAAHRDFPQDFFNRVAGGMEERAQRYKKTIGQLNRAIVSLASDQDKPSPQAIALTIQNHQNAIMTLAGQLEMLQLRMNDLRALFADDYRERTNSMRDPFEVARQEKGLPPVRA